MYFGTNYDINSPVFTGYFIAQLQGLRHWDRNCANIRFYHPVISPKKCIYYFISVMQFILAVMFTATSMTRPTYFYQKPVSHIPVSLHKVADPRIHFTLFYQLIQMLRIWDEAQNWNDEDFKIMIVKKSFLKEPQNYSQFHHIPYHAR